MTLSDIYRVDFTDEEVKEALDHAEFKRQQRQSSKTAGGSVTGEAKGTLAQIATSIALNNLLLGHDFISPYTELHKVKKEFDILLAGENLDVKCRGWWDEKWFNNHELMMNSYEEKKKDQIDKYIFTTASKDLHTIYILGGIDSYDLWNGLHEPEQFWDKAKTKPRVYKDYGNAKPVGYIRCKELKPFRQFVRR